MILPIPRRIPFVFKKRTNGSNSHAMIIPINNGDTIFKIVKIKFKIFNSLLSLMNTKIAKAINKT